MNMTKYLKTIVSAGNNCDKLFDSPNKISSHVKKTIKMQLFMSLV